MNPTGIRRPATPTTVHRARGRRGLVGTASAVMLGSVLLTACATPTESEADGGNGDTAAAQHEITVDNCGQQLTFQAPEQRMFVNDGSILSIALAAGAADHVSGATVREGQRGLLDTVYGDEARSVDYVADEMELETVLANEPDLVFAGWSYGFKDSTPLNPEGLADHGIGSYVLSESCRSGEGRRGTMDPWDATETDLRNIAEIAGDPTRAGEVVDDIDARR